MKTDFSNFFNLNLSDLVKGVIMSVIGAVLSSVYTGLESGSIDWSVVWKVSLSTGVGYLMKNLFTPVPDTVVIDPRKTEAVDKNGKILT